ncbi:cytochrome P450 [Ascobolus immersus RN42]|uniref:Cytochrome P450 n=1 Tax=Ascobolus immersus RN42 TaxID=1160509 RepID=A0A3N4I1X7_ASCIM|nr:cytochrome P450 [Ascobolus immersus RN42]
MATSCSNFVGLLDGKLHPNHIDSAQKYCERAQPLLTLRNVALAFLLYQAVAFIITAIYRITFHPLAKFPGPFLAKITPLYEYYYTFVKDGKMVQHCMDNLHPQYGPIVRTMPNHLTINDSDAFHEVHSVGMKYLKDPGFYEGFRCPDSSFSAVDPYIHRKVRGLLNPMFSKATVLKHEPVVLEKAALVVKRIEGEIEKAGGNQTLLAMRRLIYAYIFEIASDYIFAGKYDILNQPDMKHRLLDGLVSAVEALPMATHLPTLAYVLEKLFPYPVAVKLGLDALTGQAELRQGTHGEVKRILAERESGTLKKKTIQGKPSVLSDLLDKGDEPGRVAREANFLIGAALEESAWTILATVYQLAANKDCQQRFYEELKQLSPNKEEYVSFQQAESNSYVAAVIKEALRVTTSVSGFLPRVCPPEGATIAGKHIPGGTVLDMSIYMVHNDPKIFPNPKKFDPERWLQPNSKKLDRYMVGFGAGTRICLGMQLAYLNLYVGLSALFRKYEFDLTEEMKKEGWLWTEKMVSTKRGLEPDFLVKHRED